MHKLLWTHPPLIRGHQLLPAPAAQGISLIAVTERTPFLITHAFSPSRPPNAQSNGSAAPAPDASAPPPPGSTPIELQGFLDTERSYTNAFHKTLSLFVDDKTFSTPSLRGAVVGFLEVSYQPLNPELVCDRII